MQKVQQSELAQVSTYDRTAGMLNASLILVGFLVATLFIIWMTMSTKEERLGRPKPGTPPILVEVATLDELADLKEFTPAAAPQFKSDIQSLSDAVSTVKAGLWTKVKNESDIISDGLRKVGPTGIKDGDDGAGPNTSTPPHKRWKMTYQCGDISEYRNLLEQYQIKIGVVNLSSNRIQRISVAEGQFNVLESDRKQEESSFYFHNAKTIARRWDQRFVRNLGIDVAGTTTVHFYDAKTLAQLAELETQRVEREGKTIDDISKTQFKIESSEAGFQLKIEGIEYK